MNTNATVTPHQDLFTLNREVKRALDRVIIMYYGQNI